MGTVNVTFASVGGPSGAMPAYNGRSQASENITSSGTSAQSTNTAPRSGTVARIAAVDASVYVKTGDNPTAAAGDWFLALGTTIDLFLEAGDKVAVINA